MSAPANGLLRPRSRPKRARRRRQRDRNTFACAPMPVLRRPDDHHRDVRRSAPRATPRQSGSGSTPHDHRRASRLEPPIAFAPPARRSRRPTSSRGRQSSPDRRARARAAHPRDRTRSSSSFPPPDSAPPASAATHASRPQYEISIGRARPNGRPFLPGFLLGRLSNAGPGPRTTVPQGPASEPLHRSGSSRLPDDRPPTTRSHRPFLGEKSTRAPRGGARWNKVTRRLADLTPMVVSW